MRIFLFSLAALAVLGRSWAAEDLIVQSFEAPPGGKLVMKVDRGSIRITTGPAAQAEIRVERELRRVSASRAAGLFAEHPIEMDSSGGVITVRADRPKTRGWGWFRRDPLASMRVAYVVQIPARFDADVQTAGGNLEINDLTGRVRARTAGGSVTVNRVHGPADVGTSGGNIRIDQLEGSLAASTSGGNITADAVRGAVEARTSGGSIRLAGVDGPVRASTAGGNVSAELTQAPSSGCELRTAGGNVSLTLPASAAFDLEARTSGGRIESDFAEDLSRDRRSGRLSGQVNGGGPEVVLSTSGGNVAIRRR